MKRVLGWLAVVLSCGLVTAAWAAEDVKPPGETPGEALQKAQPEAGPPPTLGGFAGGLFEVDAGNDDLVEPTPLGTREDFERRGYELVDEGKVEMVVDPQGQIYIDRIYQGVIPGIRNHLHPHGRYGRLASKDVVLWAGFQPMSAVSRVFWLLSNGAPRFEVTRLGPKRLEVFFPGARILHRNTIRTMITKHFSTPVESIDGFRVRSGVRYLITLKQPANYLYRYEAPFLYLDFESDGS